jgi:hypothetical protein
LKKKDGGFVRRGLHVAADEGGLDGNFPVSAIDEHTELHTLRPAMRKQGVERRPRGAPGEENVIHQHDILVLNLKSDLFLLHDRLRSEGRKVVAIKSDIQGPDGNFSVFNTSDNFAQALCDGHATAANAD